MICVFGQTTSAQVVDSSGSTDRVVEFEGVRVVIPDVAVLTHERKRVSLYSDLISNKIVVLNFFYTRCSYICGIQGENLTHIQAKLGKRLGRDVFMISISMDPETDTPERLKGWARMLRAKRGWTLVSSTDPQMLKLIKDFTGNSPGPREVHSARIFIGNDRTGKWTTADGLGNAGEIVELVERLDRVF